MIVYTPTSKDIPELAKLGKVLFQESYYGKYYQDKDGILNFLKMVITDKNSLIICIKKDGKIIGLLLAGITKPWYGMFNMAIEHILYVDPFQRNTYAGAMMIKHFIKWSKHKNVDEIIIDNSTGIKTEKVGKFFEHFGFEKFGGIYKYDGEI